MSALDSLASERRIRKELERELAEAVKSRNYWLRKANRLDRVLDVIEQSANLLKEVECEQGK